jgi:hypothetical protein
MHTNVRNVPALSNKVLAQVEGHRDANGFHDNVEAIGLVDVFSYKVADASLHVADVVDVCCAHFLCKGETVVVHVEEDELAWCIELRGQAGCETDWPSAYNCDSAARRYLPAEDADLEARGEYVAEDEQGAFINALRHVVKRGVGVLDANVFGLSAVMRMTEDPARLDTAVGHAVSKEGQ